MSPVTTNRPAPSGAKDQVARLLTLVPYLHSHPQVRLDETARAVGSTPEQVVKDLGVLFMCGLPGGYPDDLIDVDLDALEDTEEGGLRLEGVIRVSNADYLARPLRLTPTEATAIIVALRALRGTASPDTREVVDRALAKLEAAAGASTGRTPLVEPGEDDDAGATRLRASLEDAVARGRQVRLTYYVPARDEESERVVDPRGVVTSNGVPYLDAWCHSAEAPRLFRLDRIHEAAVLDSPVETAPEPPRDLSDGLFQRSQQTTLVTLALQPQARWVVEYYQVEQVRQATGPGSDGTLEVDMQVADERWLRRLLMRLAPHARVVSPPELDADFRSIAQRTLSLYAPGP
jgi:proteasome accessory factor C